MYQVSSTFKRFNRGKLIFHKCMDEKMKKTKKNIDYAFNKEYLTSCSNNNEGVDFFPRSAFTERKRN